MMVAVAQAASDKFKIVGATATRSPPMIVDAAALVASAEEVVEIGLLADNDVAAVIVSAFGDPGVKSLRQKASMPVVGIAEASMIEAAANGRRFGVATTTPDLVTAIDARAVELGFGRLYTGVRLAPGDPHDLVADSRRLVAALGQAVSDCIERDKAEAVIIGGGPLAGAAATLATHFAVPIIAPIPAAIHLLSSRLDVSHSS